MNVLTELIKFGLFPLGQRFVAARYKPLRFVTTRGSFPFNTQGAGGTNYTRNETNLIVRTGRQRTGDIRAIFCNAYAATAGETFATPADLTIEAAVYISGSFTWPFTWGGQKSPVLYPGGGLVISDPIHIDAAPGATLQLRSGGIVASGGLCVVNRVGAFAESRFASTSGSSQVYGSSSMTLPDGGSSSVYGFAPIAVIGETDAPQNAWMGWGDSIMHYANDGTGEATYGYLGWFERGLGSVNGYPVPFCNVSRTGDSTTGYNLTSIRRKALMKYATHVMFGLGRNDITAGTALATIQANILVAWADARAAGCKVHQSTITPKTSSTDSWATVANQTVVDNSGASELRGQLNAWFVTKLADGTIDGLFDLSAAVSAPGNPDKWAVTGAANYATSDGLHPSPAMHAIAGAAFSTYAAALPVQGWLVNIYKN